MKDMLIEKYKPEWVQKFKQIQRALIKGLPDFNYQIEHVGSTAVPGLDAKEIIDIDIIYYSEEEFTSLKSGLVGLGYFHNGDQGIDGRDVFKRSATLENGILDQIEHHLYVCHYHNKELKRHLVFRDFLRQNAWAREEYQRIKYEIAVRANQDKKAYAHLKEQMASPFIERIIHRGLKILD